MKTRIIVIVLALAFLSVACRRATLPHTLIVPADRRWVKTKVYLEAEQSVHITANGVVYLEGYRYEHNPNGGGSCEDAAWGPVL
jgi:hypothetical protein